MKIKAVTYGMLDIRVLLHHSNSYFNHLLFLFILLLIVNIELIHMRYMDINLFIFRSVIYLQVLP